MFIWLFFVNLLCGTFIGSQTGPLHDIKGINGHENGDKHGLVNYTSANNEMLGRVLEDQEAESDETRTLEQIKDSLSNVNNITIKVAETIEKVDNLGFKDVYSLLDAITPPSFLIKDVLWAVSAVLGKAPGHVTITGADETAILEELSRMLLEMFKSLKKILEAVENIDMALDNDYQNEYASKIGHLSDVNEKLMETILNNDTENIDEICEELSIYRISFRLKFENKQLKLALMSESGDHYNEKKYTNFAITTIGLLFHSLIVKGTCDYTRFINDEKYRKWFWQQIEGNEEIAKIRVQIENDQFYGLQKNLKIVEQEAGFDPGKAMTKTFSKNVFEHLKRNFSTYEMLFITWSADSLDKPFENSFDPYRDKDKPVQIQSTADKTIPSYVHYWFGHWNRNMILHVRQTQEIFNRSEWRRKVYKCGQSQMVRVKKGIFNCTDLLENLKQCLDNVGTQYALMGCFNSKYALQIECSENLSNDLADFGDVLEYSEENEGNYCTFEPIRKCPKRVGYVYVVHD